MALLTSRTLATGVTGTDLIHIVITGDTSQNPAGSSYKANIDQVKDYLSTYFVNSTGNTSASCITDLYITNVYGCSPITIHDSIQMNGSGNIGVLSAAFGNGCESIGDYSFVQGESSATGEYGYNSTSIVSGVITLDTIYGDVTTEFGLDIVLDDYKYDNLYGVIYTRISSIIFNGTNTVITLNDVSINTTQAHIGSDIFINPSGSDVFVGGHYSHAKGKSNSSISMYSNSEGGDTKTFGTKSHSEGISTTSIGIGSHSEGSTTISRGNFSHSEGNTTTSSGNYSHSEGESTNSLGLSSHAEGYTTISQGNYSHSEGNQTNSSGSYSHTEGNNTISDGNYSHAEGAGSRSDGESSHAEGSSTLAKGASSHSEGSLTISIGDFSHAEGGSSKTGQYGYYSSSISSGFIYLNSSYGDVTSEFVTDIILDDYQYDNVYGVTIFSILSVTFDGVNTIIGLNDGSVTTTQAKIGVVGVTSPAVADQLVGGYYSHAEGDGTLSLGPYSHSQGKETISLKVGSFSSGFGSNAFGDYSFIHSYNSTVNGANSVVLGGQNIIGNTDDTVYVPYLNIRDLASGTSVNNLGVDSQGNVVVGSSSGSLTPPVTLSGSGITVLTLIGSGNTVPVFEIQGSSGQLFSVNDSLIGSLFSVNNISALPVFEVFSDNTILMGDYNSPSLNSTTRVTASSGTSTTIYSIPTSAYTGAFFEYTVGDGTNFRSGNITSVWDGSNVQFIDSYAGGSSPEIGSTSDISFSVGISSGNAELSSSATTTNWDVKVIVRSI